MSITKISKIMSSQYLEIYSKYFHETWYAYNGKCGNDALPIYFSEVKGHVTENGKKT